jgi:hypothetical protein
MHGIWCDGSYEYIGVSSQAIAATDRYQAARVAMLWMPATSGLLERTGQNVYRANRVYVDLSIAARSCSARQTPA